MKWLLLTLGLLNLFAGLTLLFLGGQYLLSMYGLIDIPRPVWVGWFVNDLFGMGMSEKSSNAVVWAMMILGVSLITINIDYIYIRLFKKKF